jgi:glycerol-3-phosphate acyltransferase PlsY
MPIASLLFFFAYFFGSLSSAIVVCRVMDLPDPRTEGSRNPGATNVLRIAGKREAAIVLVCDILKGTIPVVIAQLCSLPLVALGFIGLSAVIGHMFPIYYRFRGGKGVATAMGVFFGLQFLLGVFACAIWLIVLRIFNYSSLASIVTMIVLPFSALAFLHNPDAFIPMSIIMILTLLKHRENIGRLIENEEPHTLFFKKATNDDGNEAAPSKPASSKGKKGSTPKKKTASAKKSTKAPKKSKKAS